MHTFFYSSIEVLFTMFLIHKMSSRLANIIDQISPSGDQILLKGQSDWGQHTFCLCCCLTSQSTIFQPCQDDFRSSWFEPVLSRG